MSLLNEALEYAKLGLSIIPVDQKKIPLIKWLPYQEKQASEDEIKEWWGKYPSANIGIITGKISGITVLDCDSREAITQFRTIYKGMTACAKTPRGAHYYFKHEEGTRNTVKVGNLDMDIRGEGGYVVAPPSVNEKGLPYVWKRKLVDPSALDSLKDSLSLYRGNVESQNNSIQHFSTDTTFFYKGRRDEDIFHVANALVKGRANPEITRQVVEILAKNCDPPFPEKEIDAKIGSALERARRRERNLSAEIWEFLDSTNGNISSTEIYNLLQISTLAERKNTSIILRRLAAEGKIEKVGTKNGVWRKVNNDMEFMDFVNVEHEKGFDLEIPLDIHKKTIFLPKAVIVIAGVTGYGKTTWLLNIIRDNMHKYLFYYFNSEISALGLNKKLSYFNMPIEAWNMNVIPDHIWDYTNIADKIFPDDVNVIDYLQPEGEKTFNIHGVVTAIIKKLNKGMAIIATQKKPDAKLSDGGVYSAKASSLYLSLDWGKIEVWKNRYREEDPHPMYTLRDFEIIPGQHIKPKGGWYNETSKKDAEKKKQYADYGVKGYDKDFPHEE